MVSIKNMFYGEISKDLLLLETLMAWTWIENCNSKMEGKYLVLLAIHTELLCID